MVSSVLMEQRDQMDLMERDAAAHEAGGSVGGSTGGAGAAMASAEELPLLASLFHAPAALLPAAPTPACHTPAFHTPAAPAPALPSRGDLWATFGVLRSAAAVRSDRFAQLAEQIGERQRGRQRQNQTPYFPQRIAAQRRWPKLRPHSAPAHTLLQPQPSDKARTQARKWPKQHNTPHHTPTPPPTPSEMPRQ